MEVQLYETTSLQLYETTSLGSTYYIDLVFKNYTTQLERRVLPMDLV